MDSWRLQALPYKERLETERVLRALLPAHSALAELKGMASSIPNQSILINTLGIQEAKDSSAIENIITTHDDLYKSELNLNSFKSLAAKEVQNYISALKRGFEQVNSNGLLTNKTILEIQQEIEQNNAGYRKLPGTELKNALTGEVVYTPPQNLDDIKELMSNLEKYINEPELQHVDPIVKMAVIHFQFESIHPFYDGNGRTGRIINILYLVLSGLQRIPILYLSNYIIRNKQEYYRLLQEIREDNNWEDWLVFMIKGVEETAKETIKLVTEIKELILKFKHTIRERYKFYSQDLLNNLFKHPYTRIEFLQNELGVSRITAASYLNKLAKDGILKKEKLGAANYYVNHSLCELLIHR